MQENFPNEKQGYRTRFQNLPVTVEQKQWVEIIDDIVLVEIIHEAKSLLHLDKLQVENCLALRLHLLVKSLACLLLTSGFLVSEQLHHILPLV